MDKFAFTIKINFSKPKNKVYLGTEYRDITKETALSLAQRQYADDKNIVIELSCGGKNVFTGSYPDLLKYTIN